MSESLSSSFKKQCFAKPLLLFIKTEERATAPFASLHTLAESLLRRAAVSLLITVPRSFKSSMPLADRAEALSAFHIY
jgi:hypothetical protein